MICKSKNTTYHMFFLHFVKHDLSKATSNLHITAGDQFAAANMKRKI